MSKTKKAAVVLLSGGLDSTTVMAMAREMGFERYALSFDYGQRHALELDAAREAASDFGARDHLVLRVDLDKIGGSALTGPMAVPKGAAPDGEPEAIPVTYVPARNTVFLSLALAWAETLGAFDIFIGVNAIDYSGYPDCRPEYIEAFERMANLATKACVEGRGRVRVQTPLIQMTKAQIVQKGLALGVDFSKTHSCYDPSPGGLACGECDSCVLRKQGFEKAGLTDPALLR